MAERCTYCGRSDRYELDQHGHCDECAEELVATEHELAFGACDCEACRSVRGRYASAARRREALHMAAHGGFSTFGREGLGWQEGDW